MRKTRSIAESFPKNNRRGQPRSHAGACKFSGQLNSNFPVIIPLFFVENGTEFCHSVHVSSFPLCSGLLESRPDQVFAGPFDLTASNRQARRQSFPVIHSVRMENQIILQQPKGFLIPVQLLPFCHRSHTIPKRFGTTFQQVASHRVIPPYANYE